MFGIRVFSPVEIPDSAKIAKNPRTFKFIPYFYKNCKNVIMKKANYF